MLTTTDDLRVKEIKELSTPDEVMREIPRSLTATRTVAASRNASTHPAGSDDRLLVIVGPCSIHDPSAALDYATRLAAHCASALPTGSRSSCASISRSRAPRSAGRA